MNSLCVIPSIDVVENNRIHLLYGLKFVSVKALSSKFRGKFLSLLKKAHQQQELSFHGEAQAFNDPKRFDELLAQLYKRDWVTYCKAPFGGPRQVVNYLSRYTYRIAIRYFGILAIRNRKTKLSLCQQLLKSQPTIRPAINWKERFKQLTGTDPDCCPSCLQGKMQQREILPPIRSPPQYNRSDYRCSRIKSRSFDI